MNHLKVSLSSKTGQPIHFFLAMKPFNYHLFVDLNRSFHRIAIFSDSCPFCPWYTFGLLMTAVNTYCYGNIKKINQEAGTGVLTALEAKKLNFTWHEISIFIHMQFCREICSVW